MAKSNVFTRAKAILKAHPRKKWQECIQAASKGSAVSGVKKRVAGVKKKTTVSGVRKRKVGALPVKRATVGRIGKASAIIGKIDTYEAKYAKEKNKLKKKFIAMEINALHDKLDRLKQQYK